MPDTTIVVSGTTTGVGKTWVACALIRVLRDLGLQVRARKPVQSFDPGDEVTDADLLAAASGEPPGLVCPPHRRYGIAMAPPIAAGRLARPQFSIADLVGELDLPQNGIAVIEGVGGPRSPLASDGDTSDLVAALDPQEVLLVADAGLGAINAVLLAVTAFDRPVSIFLNRFVPADPVHEDNLSFLTGKGLVVVTDVGSWIARHVTSRPSGTPLEVG